MEKAAPDPSMDGSLLFSPSHLARFIITHLSAYLKNPGLLHYFEYAKRTETCPPLHGQHLPHHGCFTRISGVNAQCGHAGPRAAPPSSRVPQPNDSSTFYVTARQESWVGLGFKKRRIRNWRQQRREQRRPAGPRPSGRSIFAYHLGLLSIMTKSYPRAEIYDHCPGSSGKMLWVAVHHKSFCSSLVFFFFF